MSTLTMCNKCLLYKSNKDILDNGSCRDCKDNYIKLSRFISDKRASQRVPKK